MVNKCHNCGIEYWESMQHCPHCEIPNLKHPLFVQMVQNGDAYQRVMAHKSRGLELKN